MFKKTNRDIDSKAGGAVVEIIRPVSPLLVPKKADVASPAKRRKILKWLGVTLLVLLIAGAAIWYFRLYQPVLDRYNAATISLKVREGETFAIEGAKISIGGKDYVTDQNGKVTISGIVAASYQVKVSKDGYKDIVQNLSLHRGDNDLQYLSLTKQPDKVYAVKGFVQDFVSNLPLADVQVTLGNQTVQTDPSGAYAFSKVAPADIKITFTKAGYVDKQLSATVKNADLVTAQFPLVPSGQVLFVSNRTGKRALYRSAYDGSSQQPFIAAPASGEDFAISQSPDLSVVAFASTRDGVQGSDGSGLAKLYLAAADGSNVRKVADDLNTSFPSLIWAPDSKHFFYTGYTDASLSRATYKVHDVAKGTSLDLGEVANGLVFSSDGSTVAYYANVSEDQSTTTTAADGTTTTNVTKVYKNVIKTLKLATGERATLAKRPEALSALAFSSDGKSVSYTVVVDGAAHRYSDVISNGTEIEIPTISDGARRYVVSPDGKTKAFIDQRDGKTNLYTVDADGKNEKAVTKLGVVSNQWVPVWDASGHYIVFAVHKDGEDGIYVVALAGTAEPKKISDYYFDSTAPVF